MDFNCNKCDSLNTFQKLKSAEKQDFVNISSTKFKQEDKLNLLCMFSNSNETHISWSFDTSAAEMTQNLAAIPLCMEHRQKDLRCDGTISDLTKTNHPCRID